MSDEPKYRNEGWLREQYASQRRTMRDIAEECECGAATVSRWLNKHDIETRKRGGRTERRVPDQRLTDAEWLQEQYVGRRRTTYEIAEECGCSHGTVQRWLDEHNIETRSRSECIQRQPKYQRLTDAEWLREQYVEERRSTYEIAEKCGCSQTTVRRWLNKHDIETRGRSECNQRQPKYQRLADGAWLREQYVEKRLSAVGIAEKLGCSSSTVGRWLNKRGIETRGTGRTGGDHHNWRSVVDQRLTDAEWLREKYVEKRLTTSEIAEMCDCSKSTAQRWIDRNGIELRDPAPLSGPAHHSWGGGTKPYGPGFNNSKKRAVRGRDGFACQDPRCSVTQAEHRDEYGEKLHIHHLRKARDIENPKERNAKENLITLCRDCHPRWEKMADAGLVPEVIQ